MLSREDVLEYGLTFSNVYVDTPFHDPNWVLLRYEKIKELLAWTYEREGHIWGKCKGRSRMERFLEKYIFLSNSGISSK